MSIKNVAVEPLGPVHFLSPEQQSEIHCLIIITDPNNLGEI